MNDIQVMNEISMMPDVRRKWRPLSRERKLEVLKIVNGCGDKACLLNAIKKSKQRKAESAGA